MTSIKRRIEIEGDLYFEYEVSPHRAILPVQDLAVSLLTAQPKGAPRPDRLLELASLQMKLRQRQTVRVTRLFG
jgi:hypothetical protein